MLEYFNAIKEKALYCILYKYTSDHFMHEKFKGGKFHSCIAWKHNVWKLSHLQCNVQHKLLAVQIFSCYNFSVFHKAVKTVKLFSLKTFHIYAISMIKLSLYSWDPTNYA